MDTTSDIPIGFIGKKYIPRIDCNISLFKIGDTDTSTVLAVTIFTTCGQNDVGSMELEVQTEDLIEAIAKGDVFDRVAEDYLSMEVHLYDKCKRCQNCEDGNVH